MEVHVRTSLAIEQRVEAKVAELKRDPFLGDADWNVVFRCVRLFACLLACVCVFSLPFSRPRFVLRVGSEAFVVVCVFGHTPHAYVWRFRRVKFGRGAHTHVHAQRLTNQNYTHTHIGTYKPKQTNKSPPKIKKKINPPQKTGTCRS